MLTRHTFHILAVGRHKEPFIQEGVLQYTRQIEKYARVEWHLCPQDKSEKPLAERLKNEAKALQNTLKSLNNPLVIALQDGGKSMTSPQLSAQLSSWMDQKLHLAFVVGGAFGMAPEFLQTAQARLSLGNLTFNHLLVRLILLEQLYRALSIHFGGEYHHA